MAAKVHDERLLELLELLINSISSGPEHDHLFAPRSYYHTKGPRGVPIGNLTSQLFANVYLHQADLFVKQQLKVRHYARYMDDMLLFHADKRQLLSWQTELIGFLYEQLYLSVNPRKVRLYPTARGVDFVGYVIYADHIRLRSRTVRQFKQRYRAQLRAVAAGTLGAGAPAASLTAWQAHAAHANAGGLARQLADWKPRP